MAPWTSKGHFVAKRVSNHKDKDSNNKIAGLQKENFDLELIIWRKIIKFLIMEI